MVSDSAFQQLGLKNTVREHIEEIQALYRADSLPWILGYSGGKDSTASLQLVWLALQELAPAERTKQLHVISTDTLVENPVVAGWVTRSLETMQTAAAEQAIPIVAHRLTPGVQESFWVNLIGRGYPAPRQKFRWCTERLKIKPSNTFITEMVAQSGEAILVLGTRKAESQTRAGTMKRLAENRQGERHYRERLTHNAALPNCLVYSPIEDWTNDDVWLFLMQVQNPWGYNNKDLLTMYQGASEGGECPLVVDSSTPSCGDSRFGCFVCTLVGEDKSLQAMVHNDAEKDWMQPLVGLRKLLDNPKNKRKEDRVVTGPDDREVRDFRRITGLVQIYLRKVEEQEERVPDYVPGPYLQDHRRDLLRAVLRAQRTLRENKQAPSHVRESDLITLDELHEIRRIWVLEKHEGEDYVPIIYREVTGADFPGPVSLESSPFGLDEYQVLREVSESDLQYQMLREMLHVEQRYRTASRRAGLYESLEDALKRGFYENEEDALSRARRRYAALKEASVVEGEMVL
jgi:DNA sulfur modification protein DndC